MMIYVCIDQNKNIYSKKKVQRLKKIIGFQSWKPWCFCFFLFFNPIKAQTAHVLFKRDSCELIKKHFCNSNSCNIIKSKKTEIKKIKCFCNNPNKEREKEKVLELKKCKKIKMIKLIKMHWMLLSWSLHEILNLISSSLYWKFS